jgi:ATP-dependent protease La (LON) substrate-binding domain
MRRTLPSRASLDHLRKQAKDLLDGHQRAEPEALARIRDAVPAFAAMSDEALAAATFALHDAQSAIAREYGMKSWNDLRDAVAAQSAPDEGPSDALLRALMPMPFPPEVGEMMWQATLEPGRATAAAATPLSAVLPLGAIRNALFLPRAIGTIHVGRPSSLAAIQLALTRTPPTLALFAQRTESDEEPDAAALYPVGCEAYLHARHPDGEGREWLVLEGVRWIALEGIEPSPGASRMVRVRAVRHDSAEPRLAERLRMAAALSGLPH